jgi:hypothetical protein
MAGSGTVNALGELVDGTFIANDSWRTRAPFYREVILT